MGVSFEEDNFATRSAGYQKKQAGPIAGFLIKIGLAKDEKSVNRILLIIFFIFILITISLLVVRSHNNKPGAIDPADSEIQL